MKNVANQFRLIALLTLCVVTATAQTVSKTFTRSFNVEGIQQMELDLPGTVDVKPWDSPTIRFEIEVNLPSGSNPALLNELANVGRYNLSLQSQTQGSVITAPNLKRQIKSKGVEIKEQVTFTVFAPKNLDIHLTGTDILADAKNK